MQAFYIVPADNSLTHGNNDEESKRVTGLIADMLVEALHGDPSLHAIWYIAPPADLLVERFGELSIHRVCGQVQLKELLVQAIDPWNGKGCGTLRSLLSCRAVTFGLDGQAFLTLHIEDPIPVSPDPAIAVGAWPGLITETDYLDGRPLSDLRTPTSSDVDT